MYIKRWKVRILVYGFLATMAVFSFSLWKNCKTVDEAFNNHYWMIVQNRDTSNENKKIIWAMHHEYIRERREDKKTKLAMIKSYNHSQIIFRLDRRYYTSGQSKFNRFFNHIRLISPVNLPGFKKPDTPGVRDQLNTLQVGEFPRLRSFSGFYLRNYHQYVFWNYICRVSFAGRHGDFPGFNELSVQQQ